MRDLARLMASMEDNDDAPKRGPQHPEAAADKLRESWALMNAEHDLKPGDLVMFKPGFNNRKRNLDHPMLLVDTDLSTYPACVFENADRKHRFTCVIGVLAEGVVALDYMDLRFLQPWRPAT